MNKTQIFEKYEVMVLFVDNMELPTSLDLHQIRPADVKEYILMYFNLHW